MLSALWLIFEKFLRGRIFIYGFSEPLGINFESLDIFCLGKNFLIKFILTGCERVFSKFKSDLKLKHYHAPEHIASKNQRSELDNEIVCI